MILPALIAALMLDDDQLSIGQLRELRGRLGLLSGPEAKGSELHWEHATSARGSSLFSEDPLDHALLGVSKKTPHFHSLIRGAIRHLQYKPYDIDIGYGNPEAIGCGHFGCVFVFEDHPAWVLKVTGDQSDAAAWQVVLDATSDGRVDWPDSLALAKLVFAFPPLSHPGLGWDTPIDPPAGSRLYGIVMQRMWPQPKSHSWMDYIPAVDSAQEWLEGHGIELHDIRMDNVMVDDEGVLKVTDMGVNIAPSVVIPELWASNLLQVLQELP